jgi:hypothetical protein
VGKLGVRRWAAYPHVNWREPNDALSPGGQTGSVQRKKCRFQTGSRQTGVRADGPEVNKGPGSWKIVAA